MWYLIDKIEGQLVKLASTLEEKNALTVNPARGLWVAVPDGVDPYAIQLSGSGDSWTISASSGAKTGPAWSALRATRNRLLAESDWTQLSDSPLSTGEKNDWNTYRQALRDLPQNTSNPTTPTWPTAPGS